VTHSWPSGDTFTAGATAFGDWPSAYLKAGFWSGQSIAHPSGLTGNYASTINAADLHDGFSTAAGFDSSEATPASDPGGYLWRALESAADGIVSMSFGARVLVGTSLTIERAIGECFVAARVTGSTYTSATNSHTAWQDGYFFGFLNDPSRSAAWYLLRLNAGVITILQSDAFPGTTLTTAVFPQARGEIELEIADNAGDVQLTCRYTVSLDGVETVGEVFDYTDSSGSKITAAGRYGWALSGRRVISSAIVAPLCTSFEVSEGGTVRVRDEWQRSIRQAGLAITETVVGTDYTGRTMLCSWAGDFHGVAPYDKKLWRSKVGGLTNRINIKPDTEPIGSGTGEGGFLHSLRRPTDRRSQNRSLTFRFSSLQQDGTAGTTDPTNHRTVGITVRGAQTLAPSNSTLLVLGYLATVRFVDLTGEAFCELYRWRSGAAALLASVQVTVNVDTDYVLRFDAYNLLDTAGDNIGPAVLRVFLDGVQVVLDQDNANVQVTAGGTVVDGTSQRIVEGALEGLYLWCPDGDKTTFVSAWSESTLTNASGTAPQAQASIAVDGETANDTGQTFVTPYDWGVEEITGRIAYVLPYESGHRRAGHAHTRERRRWRISAVGLTTTQRNTLLSFWDDHEGCERAFSWTPPYESAPIFAHFADDTLGHRLVDRGVHAYAIDVEELFA
jgi:hypothetical protein